MNHQFDMAMLNDNPSTMNANKPQSKMGLGDVRVKEEPGLDYESSDSALVDSSKEGEKNLSRDEEDLVIYSLYQLWNKMRVCWKLLNSHLAGMSESELKQRYETTVSKKLELRQVQNLVFGINIGVKSYVVVISGREVLALKCNVKEVNGKKSYCVHPGLKQFIVEDVSEPGLLLKMLTSFLQQNLPSQFLQRDPTYIDFIVTRLNGDLKFPGGVDFRSQEPPGKDQNVLLNVKEEVLSENALYYDNNGQFLLDEDQEKVLENIIGEIGKHWPTVFKALVDMFGKPHPESPYGATFEDSQLHGKLEDYYLENLVPILGQFTPDEDAQILALFQSWGNQWARIARHLHGRTHTQVQARFTNVLASDLSARREESSVFALKIFSKPISSRKLEVNKLVVATRGSVYLLSCTPASIPCSHAQLQTQTFNYDPQKSSEQFLTFLKLTVTNQLVGVDEDDLKYVGDGIHEVVEKAEKSRNVIRDANLVQDAAEHYAMASSAETRLPAPTKSVAPESRGSGSKSGLVSVFPSTAPELPVYPVRPIQNVDLKAIDITQNPYVQNCMKNGRKQYMSFGVSKRKNVYSRFSSDEDAIVMELVAESTVQNNGTPKWTDVASKLLETDPEKHYLLWPEEALRLLTKMVRERYRNHLDPHIQKIPFNEDEDTMISSLYGTWGSRWSWMAKHMENRADYNIKNRWHQKINKEFTKKDFLPLVFEIRIKDSVGSEEAKIFLVSCTTRTIVTVPCAKLKNKCKGEHNLPIFELTGHGDTVTVANTKVCVEMTFSPSCEGKEIVKFMDIKNNYTFWKLDLTLQEDSIVFPQSNSKNKTDLRFKKIEALTPNLNLSFLEEERRYKLLEQEKIIGLRKADLSSNQPQPIDYGLSLSAPLPQPSDNPPAKRMRTSAPNPLSEEERMLAETGGGGSDNASDVSENSSAVEAQGWSSEDQAKPSWMSYKTQAMEASGRSEVKAETVNLDITCCSCPKSGCQNFYCLCFKQSKTCGDHCMCNSCKNNEQASS